MNEPSLQQVIRRLQDLEDIEAVRQLMARYHQCGDGWDAAGTHRDPEAMADLFTDDGVWDVTSRKPPPTGRAGIMELTRHLQAVPWIVHTVVHPVVQIDGDTATGLFKGVVYVRNDDGFDYHVGIYRMVAARTSDGWKFKSLAWQALSHSLHDAD